MFKKKGKINLNLEDSPLYNRRKNMEAFDEQQWTPQESVKSFEKQALGKPHLQQNEKMKPSRKENPVYDIPYIPRNSLPHVPAAQLKALGNESHIYESIKDTVDYKISKLSSTTDSPTLEKQFRNLCLQNLDLDEALQQQPPSFPPPQSLHIMSLNSMTCTRCGESFEPQEKIVNSNGQLWHTQCFVCAQCFRPFPDDIFYEFEGRKYCEHDFQVLFAPCCGKCNEFIIGRVIKAMNFNWHPQCFTCELCDKELADLGFIRNAGRALCHECNARVKAESQGKYMCHRCHSTIDGQPLRWRGDTFHPYHFNCAACGIELTADAREVKSRPGYTANDMNELYCLRCHDKMGIPICGACRRPIEERVVTALGKHWHVEHFVCAKCEKPFMGNRHYERKGLAYCETHYHELFGNLCFVCNAVIYGDVVMALNKAWCTHHFACSLCDTKMNQKTKFFEFDQKPICKKCYERFPQELKKRLKRQHEVQARGGRPIQN
ncbi:LIM and senescent cell antigen-like-containing domain protein 1 [Macrobrachium nipponense]|uniref:LIM and senescent cell antigen-like-containing domain protein 1 n=1 Tax=Macrobrachium nipponense TaxID=159736 RepID=UPI0030C890C2